MAQQKNGPQVDQQTGAMPKVKWVDTNMRTSYANVCNVASTREEVTLLFGTNQTWSSASKEVSVHLSDRIILSPYAAKRMAILLGNVVKEYERRFGELSLERLMPGGTTEGGKTN